MNKLSARKIEKRYLEVNGLIGTFDLPRKKVTVKYFSTFASSRNKYSHTNDLLKELKPMRERVKAAKLKDLNSLLQRNLDDYRVAKELIPYLLDANPPISFFPPILGVLIPKDFLSKDEETEYPGVQEVKKSGNAVYSYQDKWKLEVFKIDGNESNLGILSIDISEVDIVVLDGQHRANAFRVACGAFSEKENSVYPAFYSDIETQSEFNADLPITLIWFESDDAQIDPRFVSRRLFVDVNNTAKRVSKSRTILLDEYEIPSLLTRFFYSSLANEKSFSSNEFSLFHSEFDKESDIKISSDNVLAITNPEYIYDIFSWLTLGSNHYNQLDLYKVGREHPKNSAVAFGEIFNDSKFSNKHINTKDELMDKKRVVIKDSNKIPDFEHEYIEKLHTLIYNIFDRFILFRQHYNACGDIENCYNDWGPDKRTMWDEVFYGGEGLYYSFKNKDIKDKETKPLKNFLNAIEEIEIEFKIKRANYFSGIKDKDVDRAYDSAKSKAFQIGLFMALQKFEENESLMDKYEDFLNLLNSKKIEHWVYILNTIRKELIPGVDPKMWPSYQKLILRIIQNESESYYSQDNFLFSPDGQIFKKKIIKSFKSWCDVEDSVDIDNLSINIIGEGLLNKWGKKAKLEVDDLFRGAEIELIEVGDILDVTISIVEEEIKNLR